MRKSRINSYCKINVSLRIIKKLKSGLHRIQSFILFLKIHDQIQIREIKATKDKILFFGEFKKNINFSNNTITKLLNLLRKNNFIRKKYFEIKIKKNIPTKSGLGGGSMNAASVLIFLIKKYRIKIKKIDLFKLASKIGSDVPAGLKFQNTFYDTKKNFIKRYKKKIYLFFLLVKPTINYSTKLIYKKNTNYSKKYQNKDIIKFKDIFKNDSNDLEKVVFKMYPKIEELKNYLNNQKSCKLSRMTGSGSICVGYFKDYKLAKKAQVNIKKKFPKYWCKISKAM